MKRCYYKSPTVISKSLFDEVVLATVRGKGRELENVFILSGVGVHIWELIDGERRLEDIKKIIIRVYEVKPQEAEDDLISLFKQLEKNDCVKVRGTKETDRI